MNNLGGEAETPPDRTIWICSLSNMSLPEICLSPFTGLCVAEFYRDMGYSALVVIDDLSRWQSSFAQLDRISDITLSSPTAAISLLGRAGRFGWKGELNRSGDVTVVAFSSEP